MIDFDPGELQLLGFAGPNIAVLGKCGLRERTPPFNP
jgi:hypothetical protein